MLNLTSKSKLMKRVLTLAMIIGALLLISTTYTMAVVTPMPISADSQPSDWAVAEVEQAKELELTTARVLSDFQADITREEFAELAVRLYEALSADQASPVANNPFSDTNNLEILKANNLGIIDGVGGGIFAPEETITREQMATMFHRTIRAVDPQLAASNFVLTFADSGKVSDWAREATAYMSAQGLLGGVGNNMVLPRGTANKEQAIALSIRTFNKFSGDQQPLVSISAVGSSERIGVNETEADLLARDVLHVQYGDTRIFVGYRQVTANNQDPVVVRFDQGQRTWIRDDYEKSGDDGKAYGIVWDGGDNMYIAFSATGTQGAAADDYRRFTRDGWLTSYGRGGGARVAVIAKVDPTNGEPQLGTFLYAQLQNGNTNSMLVDKIALKGGDLAINGRSWFSPLDVNKKRIEVTGSSPFNYTIIFDKQLQRALDAFVR